MRSSLRFGVGPFTLNFTDADLRHEAPTERLPVQKKEPRPPRQPVIPVTENNLTASVRLTQWDDNVTKRRYLVVEVPLDAPELTYGERADIDKGFRYIKRAFKKMEKRSRRRK